MNKNHENPRRSENDQIFSDIKNFLKVLFLASRPKTLLASISPVIIGTSLAYVKIQTDGSKFETCYLKITFFQILICAILIQILCNFINDLWDYYKGADTKSRIGPLRVVSSGFISPASMKKVIIILTSIIILLGAFLVYKGGFIILTIGILSLIGAYIYTAGPYPLAYNALGEIFVLIFFGPIPIFGTYYLLTKQLSTIPLTLGLSTGLISSALLLVNNIRDIEEDTKNNKKTLSIIIGKKNSEILFSIALVLSFLVVLLHTFVTFSLNLLLLLMLLPFAYKLCVKLKKALSGEQYNEILGKVGMFLFIFSVFLSTLIVIEKFI